MKEAPAAFVSGVKGAIKAGVGGVTAVYDFFYEGVGGVVYEATGSRTHEAQGRAWQQRCERFQRALRAGPGATLKRVIDDTTDEFNNRLDAGDTAGAAEILGAVGATGAALAQGSPGNIGGAPAFATSSGVVLRTNAGGMALTPPAAVVPTILLANAVQESGSRSGNRQRTTRIDYPSIDDPRTGRPIHFPEGELQLVPREQRSPWGLKERGEFIAEWYKRGFAAPVGGWAQYDIHHIKPREFGGSNSFENLVPVLRELHQTRFNPFWREFIGR